MAYEVGGTSLEKALVDPIQPTYQDAGSDLVITGPGGTKTIPKTSTGLFQSDLATAPAVYIAPGAYTVTNGSGGANVDRSTGLTVPSYIVPTNIPASVNRGQNLTLNWTGGSISTLASIFLFNGILADPSTLQSSYVYILCDADASAGTFTVPSVILNLLPTNGYGTFTQKGVNISIAGIPETSFTVTGSPGVDAAVFSVFVSNGSVAAIQ